MNEAGEPVFYTAARTWKDAKNDGERWRWALDQVVENNPDRKSEVLMHRAQFSQNQFGEQTLQQWGFGWGRRGGGQADDKDESGTYALHTLKDSETIAKLATGIKRLTLPDEQNYVVLYKEIAAEGKGGYEQQAVEQLANIYQNRRQFSQAADQWKTAIAKFGAGPNGYRQQALDQIVKNWGSFENVGVLPAHEKASVEYRFRNGKKVSLVAQKIKVEQLLEDVKAYLKSDPGQPDWNKINIGNIGYRLVTQGEAKYIGEEVAKWDLKLEPRDNHWDRRITIESPMTEAGAYLVTAKMDGGNVSKIILWVSDTAIVEEAARRQEPVLCQRRRRRQSGEGRRASISSASARTACPMGVGRPSPRNSAT